MAIATALAAGSSAATQTLVSSLNPSNYGQRVTLTATVTPSTATGAVTFYDGVTELGRTTLMNGIATLSTSLLAPGTHSIISSYGDSPFSISAALSQKVVAASINGFPPAVNYPAGNRPYALVEGDFNGDGLGDLAVANYGSGNVSILLGNGDGTFKSAVNYPVGVNPIAITSGDFTGDDKTDLVVINFTSGGANILLGNGDGTFQMALNNELLSSATAVAVADYNADGIPDLAITIQATGSVTVLLGNGDGTFRLGGNYSTGVARPSFIAVGDFNGDGRPDIVITTLYDGCFADCAATHYLSVLPGKGDGTFQAPLLNDGTCLIVG